jgi:adenylate cyclase
VPADALLTADQVAQNAGVSAEFVTRLVESALLRPDASGLHDLGDVSRVQLAKAFHEGGISIENLVWATRHNILYGLDWVTDMWPAQPLAGRSYRQFQLSFGKRASSLSSVYAAFGLAEPEPETIMRHDEEQVLTAFMEFWSMVNERTDVLVSAARIAGDGMGRIQVATLDLFDAAGGAPPQRIAQGMSIDDATLPSSRINPLMAQLIVWLQRRHSEHDIFGRVVDSVERRLADAGQLQRPPEEPPAIAFVDLAQYTELTQRAGDESAAQSAASLQVLAEVAARQHRGRVVKLLGDGVMLRYGSARSAVASVLSLMAEMVASGLPAAHAGIAAGPVVVRDGDVYGHTVNLAARIAAHAAPGELLLPTTSANSVADSALLLEDVGETMLKGLDAPLQLTRVRSASARAVS